MHQTATQTAFQLKGNLFTLTVMYLASTDIEAIDAQLSNSVAKSPKLFNSMPIVLDLQQVNEPTHNTLDFSTLCQKIRTCGMIPVAIRNANATQEKNAREVGLGSVSASATRNLREKKPIPRDKPTSAPMIKTKIIETPVRSGQQIYSKNSNLIITNSVSEGAEVLADGNIHIYGSLRGRALAGVNGNQEARIFCYKLDAELISIAGIYKLKDDIPPLEAKNGVQVLLKSEQIQLTPL